MSASQAVNTRMEERREVVHDAQDINGSLGKQPASERRIVLVGGTAGTPIPAGRCHPARGPSPYRHPQRAQRPKEQGGDGQREKRAMLYESNLRRGNECHRHGVLCVSRIPSG